MSRRPYTACQVCEKPMWGGQICRPCRIRATAERKAESKMAAKAARTARWPAVGPPNGDRCRVMGCRTPVLLKKHGLCRVHYYQLYQIQRSGGPLLLDPRCPSCGKPIGKHVYLCGKCRIKNEIIINRRIRRARRARERGANHEPYTITEIAARDRYQCGLCRKRVAMTKAVPHPKAPTIDHIIPFADGGDDTRANVQLAHFICNSIKGAGGTQQLALIG